LNDNTLPSTSLVDRLTDQLKEMIMTGELGPDAPVNINAIAKQATVSLVPVREALARLSASGLLQFKPNRGYRVSPRLTPEGREALFEARELLELSAAPLAVENRNHEQMAELASLNQAMRKLSGNSGFSIHSLATELSVSRHQARQLIETGVNTEFLIRMPAGQGFPQNCGWIFPGLYG